MMSDGDRHTGTVDLAEVIGWTFWRACFLGSVATCRLLCAILLLLTSSVRGQETDIASDTGPRGMLRVMQIDDSQLQFIHDDRPLTNEEQETVLLLLFRLPSFNQVDVERWTQPIDDWQRLVARPEMFRYGFFEVRGDVIKIRQVDVLPEAALRVRFRRYFELTIQSGDRAALVVVRSIPSAWQQTLDHGRPIRESVRLHAMLLKRAHVEDKPGLVFAASRVRWHPSQTSSIPSVTSDQVLLAQLGLDISRLEEVQHKAGMTAADRECFYQSLAAVQSTEPQLLAKLGRDTFDIAKMDRAPQQLAGELYTLRGRARRAVLVHVEDQDIRTRFGIDHYYEVEVFVPLQKNVRFVDPDDAEGEGKLFSDFPFVVCVPKLPAEMPTGDNIHVPVSFSGFFLKTWAYRTEYMTGDRARTERPRLQWSPLLIGPTIVTEYQSFTPNPYLGVVLAAAFTVALLLIWFLLWRSSVGDREFAKSTLFRKHELRAGDLRSLEDH